MTSAERNDFKVKKKESKEKAEKHASILSKVLRMDGKIEIVKTSIKRIANGRALENLGIVDQMNVADLNLDLDYLKKNRSTAVKFLEDGL